MIYKLVKRNGSYCVAGLKAEYMGYAKIEPDTTLLVRYPEGDCDFINRNDHRMHSALYDLYNTSDTLKNGDEFALNGKIVYRCVGVHVVKA